MNAVEQKKQDDYFKSNIHNLIVQANAGTSPRFSFFLDERQIAMAEEILRHNQCSEQALFFGGAENCERLMLGIFPLEIEASASMFPISALQISVNAQSELSHRDYLGALMSLQLKRETIGDIILDGKGAVLFVCRDIAGFVRLNLERVGRASVTVEDAGDVMPGRVERYEERSGTISSMRLDCIVSLLINKSRSKAAQVVEAGFVRVNGLEAFSVSKQLAPGDKLTIRGYGKFILGDERKKTKKDRIFLTIKKLI